MIYTRNTSTNPVNLTKIGVVDLGIIGLTRVEKINKKEKRKKNISHIGQLLSAAERAK